jgi:hypothetical protein
MFQHIEYGESNMTQEDREYQIGLIVKKLKEVDDETVLDIADFLHWGTLEFHKASTEVAIPKKLLEKIQKKNPELLV